MKITIHHGTDQIGGCVTEYEHNGWRLFVDYGEQLPGATPSGPIEVEGLTKGDLSQSALLITHYHGDHIGKLAEVSKTIPVYMGYIGCEIYQKLQRRLSHIQGEIGENARNAYNRSCDINTFLDGESFRFGPFNVEPVKMDHSAYDSYGFVINVVDDEDNRVFHTGDFRAHGLYGEEFYDRIINIPDVKAIVCEATNIERCEKDAEPERKINERFEKLFKEHKYNSVFVSSTNIDRLFGIYRAAADKVVLMDEYQYDILKSVIGENDWSRNEAETIRLIKEDGAAMIESLDTRYEFDKGTPFVLKLNRAKREVPQFYVPEKLQQLINWKGCVLIARPTPQFLSLINGFTTDKSRKYLSMWKGYLNPNSPAYNEALAKALGTDYEYVHTSGHADPHTLETLFLHINHDTIIPMHTDNPKKFLEQFSANKWNITLLKDGETLNTADL